ncbi:hypothetical protein SAMN05192561_102201 [Halopenitus malekzadehii]|uniref:Coiled-coil protein n=1 Tax=Halopenitus malekzadehii TaxID=1267564 RepID=A0A1H6IEH2_9EURY|nr:hypothetical protein [Halopenitus malekzadehii]SEH46794.1 hypothetical protein SAMN05192561_102201 [Halopenitus malekzadehii]
MKNNVRYTLQIGGIVLVTTILGLGIFWYFGSQTGFYALIVGIPAVVIGAAVVYARQSQPTGGGGTTQYFEGKAQRVGEDVRTLLRDYEQLAGELSTWDTDPIEEDVSYLLDELAEAGVEFDRATNRFEVTGTGDVRDLERIEGRVSELRSEIADSARTHVGGTLDDCVDAQRRLQDAGLIDRVEEPQSPDGESFTALLDALDGAEAAMDAAIDDAAAELDAIAEATDAPLDPIDRGVGRADDALEAGEYHAVADALLDARDALEQDLSTDFESERSGLESFVDTAGSSVVTDYVSPALLDDLEDVHEELETVDSALDMARIRELTADTRSICTEMIDTMSTELDDHLRTLADADVPDDYYEYQSAADESYVSDLRAADDLDAYRSIWLNAAGELSAAIDAVEDEAAVAEAYGTVEDNITETLRATGRVGASDVPVKQAAAFFELYADLHENATYDPSAPALVAEDFGEAYDVTVQAGFDEGGPERRIDVSLVGGSLEESRTIETHLLDVVTFEEVPYGEYDLTVTTDEEGYGTVEREVVVDDDLELEATIAEVALREEVCSGIEDDARDALPDARDLFESEFNETEYLSTAMDFPMSDDFLPCLLALWAEEEGLTATRVDGDVLVYDGEQFGNRLANIVRHNLSEGESIPYTQIRNRYLAVPASDDLIVDTLQESPVASAIECDETEVTKLS